MDCATVSPMVDGWQWIMAFIIGGLPLMILATTESSSIPKPTRIAMATWGVLWLLPGLVKVYLYMVLA